MNDTVKNNRATLYGLALVFLGPVVLAFFLYYSGWRPAGTTEHGIRIDPVRTIAEVSFTADDPLDQSLMGRWTMLYIADGDCDQVCADTLVRMRQVRRALNNEMDRVRRVFVPGGTGPDEELMEVVLEGTLVASPEASATIREAVGETAPGDIWLVDPLGNIVLHFPAGTEMRDIHTDVKKLLRISQIG